MKQPLHQALPRQISSIATGDAAGPEARLKPAAVSQCGAGAPPPEVRRRRAATVRRA